MELENIEKPFFTKDQLSLLSIQLNNLSKVCMVKELPLFIAIPVGKTNKNNLEWLCIDYEVKGRQLRVMDQIRKILNMKDTNNDSVSQEIFDEEIFFDESVKPIMMKIKAQLNFLNIPFFSLIYYRYSSKQGSGINLIASNRKKNHCKEINELLLIFGEG